jgi:type I phosphodiesterase/nucleotide pyrophosphatase
VTHLETRFPQPGEASLADVVPSLLSAPDVPGVANPLGVEPVRRVCLLVVDGLGFVQLDANREQVPFLTTGATSVQPIAAGFPATTVASLGSLGTGRHPGEHGLVGMTMALPGQQRAMNVLRWAAYGPGPATDLRDRVAPEWFQPEPTTFERAAADRVSVHLVGPRDTPSRG